MEQAELDLRNAELDLRRDELEAQRKNNTRSSRVATGALIAAIVGTAISGVGAGVSAYSARKTAESLDQPVTIAASDRANSRRLADAQRALEANQFLADQRREAYRTLIKAARNERVFLGQARRDIANNPNSRRGLTGRDIYELYEPAQAAVADVRLVGSPAARQFALQTGEKLLALQRLGQRLARDPASARDCGWNDLPLLSDLVKLFLQEGQADLQRVQSDVPEPSKAIRQVATYIPRSRLPVGKGCKRVRIE